MDPAKTAVPAVFLSYASEDASAARRICDALRGAGVDVWFDQAGGLEHGDEWDAKIRRQIKECVFFLPVVSANTQRRHEGYFRIEWALAAERALGIVENVPFILPIAIDNTSEREALVPERFRKVQWTRLPGGVVDADTRSRFLELWAGRTRGGQPAGGSVHPLPDARSAGVPAPSAAADEKSIAVLPFANMSADAENEYFSDGMTEEIINALVQVPQLRVAARTSVFAFKGKAEDLRAIALRLNVRTVLEGSVRKMGNRIRITAQLINAGDGFHLWSERFDRSLDDIFAVQDEIARTIAEKLKVKLIGGEQKALVKAPTDDVGAYQLYLQGRYFWGQRGAGLMKGLRCFEAALVRDPNYALAHAGMADAYTLLGFYGYSRPNDVMPNARAAAERALTIEPTLAEAHCALGFILLSYDRNIPAAQRALRRAIELKPTYVPARYWFASTFSPLRRPDEAVAIDEEAVRIEPFSLFANAHLGWMLLGAGRHQEAARRLQHVLSLEPRFLMGHWLLGMAYAALGRVEDGLAELRQAAELSGNLPWMVATMGCVLAQAERKDEARAVVADLVRRSESEYVKPFLFAMLHAFLGDEESTLVWLEKAREEGDLSLPYTPMAASTFFGNNIPAPFLSPEKRAAFIERLGIILE